MCKFLYFLFFLYSKRPLKQMQVRMSDHYLNKHICNCLLIVVKMFLMNNNVVHKILMLLCCQATKDKKISFVEHKICKNNINNEKKCNMIILSLNYIYTYIN